MKQGYLYAVTGEKYAEEAENSARRLKSLYPEAHITLITDKPRKSEIFDKIEILEDSRDSSWKSGVMYKVKALLMTPYERTFFADSDLYFVEDCRELFRLLDYFDLLMAHSPVDESEVIFPEGNLKGYHPYNTGLMVFNRSEEMFKLFRDWIEIYTAKFDKYYGNQGPFMAALLQNDIKIYVLQSVYNLRDAYIHSLPNLSVKVIHGRPADPVKMTQKLNGQIRNRVWLPYQRKVIVYRKRKSLRRIIRDLSPPAFVEWVRKQKNRNSLSE